MEKSKMRTYATIAGMGIGGAMTGGVGGAAGGGALGSTLGGMLFQDEKEPEIPKLEESNSAIQRRMNQINETPLRQIADSIDSLKYIQDPVQRQELAQPLLQAQYMAMQKGQV